MYFLRGNLPWQNMKVKTKEEKYKSILNKKKEISSKELGKNFPIEFAEILDYFKKLSYTEEPDYEMCTKKLLSVLEKEKLKFDYVYDWTTYTNLKERLKLKKSNGIYKTLTVVNSSIKENKNIHKRKYSINHFIEVEDVENVKIKIKKNYDETKKNFDSNISNKADFDELDSHGLEPKNESRCCIM